MYASLFSVRGLVPDAEACGMYGSLMGVLDLHWVLPGMVTKSRSRC